MFTGPAIAPSVPDFRAFRRNQDITVVMVFVVFLCLAIVLPFLPTFASSVWTRNVGRSSAPRLCSRACLPLWGRRTARARPYVILLVMSAAVQSPELLVLRAGIAFSRGAHGTCDGHCSPSDLTGRAVGMISPRLDGCGSPARGSDGGSHRDARLPRNGASLPATLLVVAGPYRELPRRPALGSRIRPQAASRPPPHIPIVPPHSLVGFGAAVHADTAFQLNGWGRSRGWLLERPAPSAPLASASRASW